MAARRPPRLPTPPRRARAAGPTADPGFAVVPPGLWNLLLEARAPIESAAFFAAMPFLLRLPRGDGHAVLVFPGMGANDLTTLPLRTFLGAMGHRTQAWGQGTNRGPRRGVLERCSEDVQRLARESGGKVSLVGWSLGGIYAREMAKLHPTLVRGVVTLGTPFTGHPRSTNAWRVYQWLTGESVGDPRLLVQVRRPPPVPTTSIYSRTDGIVAWSCSLNEPSPIAENIEVHASHVGMGMNPLALYAVADRLRQPDGRWQAFDAGGARRWFFRVGAGAIAAAA